MRKLKWKDEIFKVWDGKSIWPEKISIVNGIDEMYCGDVNNLIFLQYTGLKDKNGKEIYEGDIVLNGSMPMIVIYQAPSFVMKEKRKKGYSSLWSEFIKAPENNQFEEVIGNIYENPELLEDNK